MSRIVRRLVLGAVALVVAALLLASCGGGHLTGRFARTYPTDVRARLTAQIGRGWSPGQLSCVIHWGARHEPWPTLYAGLYNEWAFGGGHEAGWAPALERACRNA